jgi:arginyl-tRNA--protein-N-Asp/Glu arginylyltransferase
MTTFNLKLNTSIEDNYQQGLLPQRNQKDLWYQDSSSRSNLQNFNLNSENRRILRKTEEFIFKKSSLAKFNYTPELQKTLITWTKKLGWDFPASSIKTIFNNHIFNQIYVWKDKNNQEVAYSICYFSDSISQIAYVFYNPKYQHSNLPIRLVLQTIIDSHQLNLKYTYLGRFSNTNGYYKRTMPAFEHFKNKQWLPYKK